MKQGNYSGIGEVTRLKRKPANAYTVTFFDKDESTVIATAVVSKGRDATPPTPPEHDGFIFDSWSGNYTNVQQNEVVQAVYVGNSTLSLMVGENGAVSVNGINYASGEHSIKIETDTDAILLATANESYLFNGWTGDLTGDSNPSSLFMNADKTVTAEFVEDL